MFIFFVTVGSIICFAGRTLFKPVLFLTGILLATSFIMFLFYSTFLSTNTKPWVGWVVLTCSVLAGVCLGFLFMKLAHIGAFCLAGFGGYTLGLLMFNAFMYKTDSNTAFWCFTLGTAILMGTLALCFFDHILIHSTSLLGSFMFIYGIGLVAGHYTNPFTIITLIQHGQIDGLDPIFYAYLAGNLVMYGLGCALQYKHKSNNPDHDPYKEIRDRRYKR